MNNFKKIISTLVVAVLLCMTLGAGVGAYASTPAAQTVKVTAGETVTVTFSESDCYGVSGSITYSNRDLFSSVTPGNSPYGQIREKSFILSSAEKVECTVTLSVKIKDTAAVGDKCVISFTDYLRVDNNVTLEGPEGLTKTVTLEVKQKETTQPSNPTTPTDPKPQQPTTPADPKPSTPNNNTNNNTNTNKPTTQTPATPSTPATPNTNTNTNTQTGGGLDFRALNRQINIANSLVESEYTTDSWTAMKTALDSAVAARNAKTQNQINNATTALKDAVAALVRVNAAELKTLLESASKYVEEDAITTLKEALEKAIADADAAIKSGDAQKIDAAKTALDSALNAYKAKLDELGSGQIVEVEKPVEVTPTSPFCNIAFHKLLIILLIVSVIINLGLGALIGFYFYKRRQNLKDDTPLVEYDIDED